ncbi:UvrD-helicase domain-containing protein [Metallibacterium scheffleri]|uniref:DNA 3'-5' helicase n=1 Tax=Metallibacterium scheffleri TaxID=993689 RepID=A0A4S3KPV4_9GAMM|nr:ATP-dependent helicase [Metallibacterium scheffleri]THD10144.1 ATP-dependent DNA helicase [Metallibacterium scheffleri]
MTVWVNHDLNEPQKEAIREAGSVFLVACPGSGKTRTLTFKIAEELSKLESPRQCLVAITYTHRAADEIKGRIERLGVDASRLWIGTIHSFCLEWILRPYGIYHDKLKHGFSVASTNDSEKLLTDLCAPYRSPKVTYWDCGFYFTKDGYTLTCRDSRKHGAIDEILEGYFRALSKDRKIDFELMLYYAYELISENPSIAKLLSGIFPLILIDEYQDTKEIQYSIVSKILAAGAGQTRAFVVGDPNQAIFQSLGGFAITPKEFAALSGVAFKEAELTYNYRSSERIINYFGHYGLYGSSIEAASKHKAYPSIITYNATTSKDDLEDQLVALIRYNIDTLGIEPSEICILAPQWVHLAGMTRRLVNRLPEYEFDGPGMVPFARDPDNFWYKLARIALTSASPELYVRRLRWAKEVLIELDAAGVSRAEMTPKRLLREANNICLAETDGLKYVELYFGTLFSALGVDFTAFPALQDQYVSFFESSTARIERLRKEGTQFIREIAAFRRVFRDRSGITLSTIHGIKGDEYDTVIAYALLEGMVPHFADTDGSNSAKRLLYVIASRARKNLHLIAERGRRNGLGDEYVPTDVLRRYRFNYNSVAE